MNCNKIKLFSLTRKERFCLEPDYQQHRLPELLQMVINLVYRQAHNRIK